MKKKFDAVEFQRKKRAKISLKMLKLNSDDIIKYFNASLAGKKEYKKAA